MIKPQIGPIEKLSIHPYKAPTRRDTGKVEKLFSLQRVKFHVNDHEFVGTVNLFSSRMGNNCICIY